jgi:hypothetical protein
VRNVTCYHQHTQNYSLIFILLVRIIKLNHHRRDVGGLITRAVFILTVLDIGSLRNFCESSGVTIIVKPEEP